MEMNLLIDKVKDIALENFEETASPVGINKRKRMVVILSKVIDDYEIWGGIGDRTKYVYVGIDKSGWIKHFVTTEIGHYQKGDGVADTIDSNMSNEELITYINSDAFDDEDRIKFSKKCKDFIAWHEK